MEVRTLISGEDLRRYREWILTHPQGNLWQSLEWKGYQESLGRTVKIYVSEEAGHIIASAMAIIDRTTFGLCTWNISRGPMGEVSNKLLDCIINDAKADRCMTLYLSAPQAILEFYQSKITASCRCEQPEATRIIDLTQSENQILAQMHPKGRYNIGVARKHGIEVETRDSRVSTEKDIDAFYSLLKSTGGRDGFKISQKSHYARFLTDLKSSFILMAKHQGKAVAGLLGVVWNRTGFYYYGASSYEHRHLMAPYLLQWEAIMHCKRLGCMRYDLLGIAPEESTKNNPWAGITEFKRKFGGEVITYPKEQMIVLRPIVKKMLEWKRRVIG